jgi:hypothetical protein
MTATAVAAVIPAKDEADRIAATVAAVRALDAVDLVVVVDDGSSDGTADLARGAGAYVVRHPRNRGKAAAMATGAGYVTRIEYEQSRASGRPDPTAPTPPTPVGAAAAAASDPRALLFVDADLQESAANLGVLIPPVLGGEADMTIATLPPQAGAGGRGFVVRLARSGIEEFTGFRAVQPLSGMRCLSRRAFDAATPLARGWGVEVGLTIDVLLSGMQVLEVPCELRHRPSGTDWRGQLHRARQYRDVALTLAARRLRRVTG